jgi:uncharacterized membrane protein
MNKITHQVCVEHLQDFDSIVFSYILSMVIFHSVIFGEFAQCSKHMMDTMNFLPPKRNIFLRHSLILFLLFFLIWVILFITSPLTRRLYAISSQSLRERQYMMPHCLKWVVQMNWSISVRHFDVFPLHNTCHRMVKYFLCVTINT